MAEDDRDHSDLSVRQASREASGWMTRLQDSPDDVMLRQEFDDWLSKPVNAAAWEEMQRMMRAVAAASPRHAARWGAFLKEARAGAENGATPDEGRTGRWPPSTRRGLEDAARIRASTGRPYRRRAFGLAGLAAVAAILAVVAGPELTRHLQADYATATAETRTLRLADDSVITVAPASAIAVSYAKGARQIRLLSGEVYVEVTPDAARPFLVSTDSAQVTVLGTAFNVSQGDDGAEVGVAYGAVQVEQSGSGELVAGALGAGEFVRVERSGAVQRGKQPASQIGAWRQNQLIAQDQPLRDVLDRLRRYHAGAIVVTDGSLAEQPVTGVYDLGKPIAALRAIARSQNAVVREITPWLLIVSRS